MRPKNLKFPFTWEERKPALHEGVLIVPQYYSYHAEWKDDQKLFSKKKSMAIEFCSGNGEWIIDKALQNPSKFWIAVEMQFERVRKIWSKMQNHQISNLLIVCGKAETFVQYYLPEESVEEVFVNFPDPWPKPRHAKHRLIQNTFIDHLSRIVKKEGRATFATDDFPYCSQMIDVMDFHSDWTSDFPSPFYIKNWEGYGSSWFERLWKEKGREFYYTRFIKKS